MLALIVVVLDVVEWLSSAGRNCCGHKLAKIFSWINSGQKFPITADSIELESSICLCNVKVNQDYCASPKRFDIFLQTYYLDPLDSFICDQRGSSAFATSTFPQPLFCLVGSSNEVQAYRRRVFPRQNFES